MNYPAESESESESDSTSSSPERSPESKPPNPPSRIPHSIPPIIPHVRRISSKLPPMTSDSRVDALEQQLASLIESFKQREDYVTNLEQILTARIEYHHTHLKEIIEDCKSKRVLIDTLTKKIEVLEQDLQDKTDRIISLEQKFIDAQKLIKSTNGLIQYNIAQVENHKDLIDTNTQNINSLLTDVEHISESNESRSNFTNDSFHKIDDQIFRLETKIREQESHTKATTLRINSLELGVQSDNNNINNVHTPTKSSQAKSLDDIPTYGTEIIDADDLIGFSYKDIEFLINRISKNKSTYKKKQQNPDYIPAMEQNLGVLRAYKSTLH